MKVMVIKHLKTVCSILISYIFFINSIAFVEGLDNNGLTLEKFIEYAKNNNEIVKIQLRKIRQYEEKIVQAQGGILPAVSFSYQTYFRDTANNTISGQGTDSRIIVSQPLYYGSRKRETINISKSEKRIRELQLKNTLRKLESDVATAFYQIAQAESDSKNTNETITMMINRKNEINERVRLGKSRESELYVLDSQIAVLRANLQKLQGEYDKAVETLAFLTNLSTSVIKISDVEFEPKYVDSVEQYISTINTRTDVVEVQEAIDAQLRRVRVAKASFSPTLDLNSYWYTARSGSLSNVSWDLYLLFGIPIYQGGILKSRVDEEVAKLEELNELYNMVLRSVKTEVRQPHTSLVSSISQVESFKDAYIKAKKSYDLQLKDYQLGLVNNLDVIQATFTLLDVKTNLDRSILRAKQNKVLLDIAVKDR